MKKQTPKAKRLTEAKAKHLKTVKRRQLSEIKKSIRKYKRLNENEGENRFVGQTGDLPGEESMANRDIKALEELLKKYSIEKINITLRILDDPTHWKNPEIRTPEEKKMFQNRNAKKTGNMYTPGAEHPLNEVKNSLKKSLKRSQRLNENEGEISVNINQKDDYVEITYKGESYKSALGDELLFIHYFEEDEQAAGLLHRGENDAPEIFKYLKGKGGELLVDDEEATLTINMSNLK